MATTPKQTFNSAFTSLSSTLGSGGAWQPAISWAPNGLTDPTTTSWSMNPAWGPTSAVDANVFSISNGVLSVAVKPTPSDVKPSDVGGAPFLSGELTTHDTFSQTYGYFEMSARMPGTPGMQAAFWLLPEDGSWPPELDAVEVLGSQPGTAVDTAHSQASGSHTANPHWAGISDASKTFHTYGVDWEADKITWYVDGKQTAQEATPADMHKLMYMLLSTIAGASSSWVGAPAAGSSDAMQVAWVHAYASMPDLSSAPAPTPAASTTVAPAADVGTGAPAPAGTGADTLVLNLSEDAYQGNAQFQLTVDGKAAGPAQSVTALHGKGQSEAFAFKGDWSGAHAVGVTFTNDAWGGSADVDRNLYIDGATFDGTAVQGAAALYGNGTVTLGTTAGQPPQAGAASQAGTVPTGTSSSGSTTTPAAGTSSGGTATPAAAGTGADTLVLRLSVTAAQGDAQFSLTVDGKPVGAAQSVTAAHGQGQSEAFAFKGDWGSGSHTVGVGFANPSPGSTTDLARSLYLDGASYDGTPVQGSTQVTGSGPVTFALTPSDTLAVTDNDGSGATVPLAVSGTQTDHPSGTSTVQQAAGGGTDTITSSGSMKGEALTLGGGTRKLVLVNPRAMVLTGGSGADTVTADSGANQFVAGTGSLDVTGGPEAAAYVLHSSGGPLTVEDFDPGKGDTLAVDKALQGALVQAPDDHGGTLLTFGAKQGSINLISHASVSPSAIHFI